MTKKIKKNVGKALIATAVTVSLFSLVREDRGAEARNIQTITNFVVPSSTSTTGDSRVSNTGVGKVATGRRGVVNLSGSSTGSPLFVATMRGSNRAARGSVSIFRGERMTFSTPNAESGFNYWLYMRTSNTGTAANRTVSGSWSPDEY